MNTGIKNKLKTLIGENIQYSRFDTGVLLMYPPKEVNPHVYKILRIEGEDCVVLGNEEGETFLSIDHIFQLLVKRI